MDKKEIIGLNALDTYCRAKNLNMNICFIDPCDADNRSLPIYQIEFYNNRYKFIDKSWSNNFTGFIEKFENFISETNIKRRKYELDEKILSLQEELKSIEDMGITND